MCGRLNIIHDPLFKLVSEALRMQFNPIANDDLRPTQELAAIVADTELHQQNMTWGIKPSWAKKLLINAQAETVQEKPTFRRAFAEHRCIVPCSGWYEWSERTGSKRKYLFAHPEGKPLYMAGIYYPAATLPELVTLTTQPSEQCSEYHHRMPLLIDADCVEDWLTSTDKASQLVALPVCAEFRVST
jgi:putative SOS response-associated peptidase YedK